MKEQQEQSKIVVEQPKKKAIPTRLGSLIILLAATIAGAGVWWYSSSYEQPPVVDWNSVIMQLQERREVKNELPEDYEEIESILRSIIGSTEHTNFTIGNLELKESSLVYHRLNDIGTQSCLTEETFWISSEGTAYKQRCTFGDLQIVTGYNAYYLRGGDLMHGPGGAFEIYYTDKMKKNVGVWGEGPYYDLDWIFEDSKYYYVSINDDVYFINKITGNTNLFFVPKIGRADLRLVNRFLLSSKGTLFLIGDEWHHPGIFIHLSYLESEKQQKFSFASLEKEVKSATTSISHYNMFEIIDRWIAKDNQNVYKRDVTSTADMPYEVMEGIDPANCTIENLEGCEVPTE